MLRYDLRHVRVVLRTDRQGHYCPAWEDRISVQWKFPKFPWFRCVQRAQQGSVLNLMCSFELVLWVAQSAWCVKHIGKDVYAMSAAQRKGSMQSRGRVWELQENARERQQQLQENARERQQHECERSRNRVVAGHSEEATYYPGWHDVELGRYLPRTSQKFEVVDAIAMSQVESWMCLERSMTGCCSVYMFECDYVLSCRKDYLFSYCIEHDVLVVFVE